MLEREVCSRCEEDRWVDSENSVWGEDFDKVVIVEGTSVLLSQVGLNQVQMRIMVAVSMSKPSSDGLKSPQHKWLVLQLPKAEIATFRYSKYLTLT